MKKPFSKKVEKLVTPKVSQTSWEPVASWYDELLSGDDTYQSKVILPNLLRLVAAQEKKNGQPKKIIDIACGQGFFSHAFAAADAEVLGLDISPELIAFAQKNSAGASKVEFAVASAENLVPASSNSFDVATIVLALQNIKGINEALKEAARVLKTGGELVLVLNHPCFRIPKGSAWGFDESAKVQYRRVDKYGRPYTAAIDMAPGTKAKVQTVSFHRPLQEYFKALAAADFVVAGLEEWISHKKSEAGPRAAAEDAARKEFPMFLTLVAKKQ
jgi:ubiquinone/menaquinone biosynthesis C-methylase UbiE